MCSGDLLDGCQVMGGLGQGEFGRTTPAVPYQTAGSPLGTSGGELELGGHLNQV